MRIMYKPLRLVAMALGVGCWCLSGCVTVPRSDQPSMASYVGDRASVNFDEIVVSLKLGEGSAALENLHVRLGAIINPRSVSLTDPYEVGRIVWRQQARISDRLVDLLLSKGTVSPNSLPRLKTETLEAARAVFAEAYSKWSRAKDYEVEIVVTAFYVTDLSVGAHASSPRWF